MAQKGPPRVGIMLGPHFVRMAGSFGFMKAYFDDYLHGLMPKPHNLTTVSSGSVIGLVVCPWTQEVFELGERNLLALKGSQFFSLNKELMFWGGVEAVGPLIMFAPWERIKNPWFRNLAKGLGVGAMEGFELKLIDRLWAVNGVFSNERLRQLLLHRLGLNFDNIFNSSIKLDIVSANISGDKARDLNVAPYIITNYRHEHQKPEIIVDGSVRSTSITGFFGTSKNPDGDFTTDGGVYSAFPVEVPDAHGCNVIIAIQLSYAGQGYLEHDFTKWMSALHRAFDVLVDNDSSRVLRGYTNVNNDLEQIKKLEAEIESLESLAEELSSEHSRHLYGRIESMKDSLENLTAYGKRPFNLVIIKSRRKIPEFNFREKEFAKNFRLSIEIGEEAEHDARQEIYRAIERVSG